MRNYADDQQEATIEPYDVIRVLVDIDESRSLGGSAGVEREPRKGDIATVLEIWGSSNEKNLYMAECINEEGFTVWVCDFCIREIELSEKWGGSGQGTALKLA